MSEMILRVKRACIRALRRSPRDGLLRALPRNSVCAEIGVWKGNFSEKILRTTKPKEFHLIDPWVFQQQFPDRMYGGTVAKNQKDMDLIYQHVKDKFSKTNEIIIHRQTGVAALKEFPDSYFDWLYIDGNHYYDYVISDLEACAQKVKPGGIICGDDYTWPDNGDFPVQRAVQDFALYHNLSDRLTIIESQFLIQIPNKEDYGAS